MDDATVHNYRDTNGPWEEMGPDDVRIDRATRWGNPYRITSTQTREDVVDHYRAYLWNLLRFDARLMRAVADLHGKRLWCWCYPLACHGDVLSHAAKWASKMLDKETT